MQGDLERVLFDERAILRRLDEIAAQISNDYRDRELTVIAVLNGSLVFMADLMRRIPLPLKLRLFERGELPRKNRAERRNHADRRAGSDRRG